jgi:hypothetical protein
MEVTPLCWTVRGGRPVVDAASFGRAITAGGGLRLTVRNRTKERLVKIATAPR